MPVWGSVLVVLGLIIVEGVFVASEMALVTLREGQLRSLTERMTEVMRASHGVGLAAPQIGVSRRVLVYGMRDDDEVHVLETSRGEVAWTEAAWFCRRCRRSFFPSVG